MIRMKHSLNGLTVEVKTGFSWTTFFFGTFVPLFRGMYGYAAIVFLCSVCTFGLSGFYFPFVINKAQVKSLLENGYKPASYEDARNIEALRVGYTIEESATPMAA